MACAQLRVVAHSTSHTSCHRRTDIAANLHGSMPLERDPIDLRDQVYRPSLISLKAQILPSAELLKRLADPKEAHFPRGQGSSSTCAAQALAALLDLGRLARDRDDFRPISSRMIYEMALR